MPVPYPINSFIQFRHELHQFPDLSGQEVDTQRRIKIFVSQFNPVACTPIAQTGLLVRYGESATGPVTLIRADIDALPIEEVNTFAHQSRYGGVSHKCGHDGHTAILARLAYLLSQRPIRHGRVYLLFQPAEETGKGAEAVLADPVFAGIHPDRVSPDRVSPDRVFALHNLPGYEAGVIVCKPGPFTASVLSLIVTFTGAVSHSAEPEKGLNPAYLMAEFMLQTQQMQHPDPQADTFRLITPIYTTMGSTSYGVSAGYGEIHLTLRTRSARQMDVLTDLLTERLTRLSAESGIAVATRYTEAFVANENSPDAVEQIRECAQTLGYSYVEKQEPFKWGEDFGLFTQTFTGAMFGIGNGLHSPALHNDDYDFNDNLIEPAARLFLALIEREHY